MRLPGSKNKVKAKTGQLRKRCCVCGRRKYISEMVFRSVRGTIKLYACKKRCIRTKLKQSALFLK